MSVGMFATPLTLSAAALSQIPWFNFNRCSEMRIRRGDLAVLVLHVVLYACIMRMSPATFVFRVLCEDTSAKLCADACFCKCMHFAAYLCVLLSAVCVRMGASGRAVAFNSAACVFLLTRPKGTSCPETG